MLPFKCVIYDTNVYSYKFKYQQFMSANAITKLKMYVMLAALLYNVQITLTLM